MFVLLNKPVLTILASALLAGCASVGDKSFLDNPKMGLAGFQSHTVKATGKATVWIQSREDAQRAADRTRALLRGNKTLNADNAMQIALINNRGLQADFADVGITAADVWQQGLFENPKVTLSVADTLTASVFESFIAGNILALITREQRIAIAEKIFESAQHRAAESALKLAFDTKRAWVRAVAAKETVTYLEKAQTASNATSDLATELGKTGAFTKAAQAREHATYAEISGQLAEARAQVRGTREELIRLMGLWGNDTNFNLPSTLPRVPARVANKQNIESEALRKRVDLQVAKLNLEALARQYKLTNATRYITDLGIMAGGEWENEKNEPTGTFLSRKSIEVDFVIPIFDSGQARLRTGEMAYMQAANRVAERAVNIRSEAREAYDKYRSTHQLALHYRDKVVPLRKIISDEVLLEYNGMISSTFELLADTRATQAALLMSVNAKQNFWLADIDLKSAIHGGFSGGGGGGGGGTALAGGGGPGH